MATTSHVIAAWRIPTMHAALPLMDTTIHVSAALHTWRLPAMYATLQLMETTIHVSVEPAKGPFRAQPAG